MNYSIRKIEEKEYILLEDFIYEAIFIPEGVSPPPKSIINQPDLQVYIKNFGKEKDDICFVAETDNKIIGAVWVRDMNDYGHIEDGVPSFAISLYKPYRNFGIGTELITTMISELRQRGYKKASLAVQKENYAVKMYRKVGFEVIRETEEEFIMVCNL
ncbi:MAG: GNAT family N-acetyltransferase [Oscillospiraceae bacterium]|nr:GNAT family N-acetyltransferase [Oscillospiraceae bacterium]MBR4093009.1 GNAT family N-acetyltransferase [Oscillospiraceae bacterium]